MSAKVSQDVVERAIALYEQGNSLEDVSMLVGCNIHSLKSWLKAANKFIRPPGRPRSSKRQRALEQVAAGVSKAQIARELSINDGTLYRWVVEDQEEQRLRNKQVNTPVPEPKVIQQSSIRPLTNAERMQGRAGGYRNHL